MHYLYYVCNGLFYANNTYCLRLLATKNHLDFIQEWPCSPWERLTTTCSCRVFQRETFRIQCHIDVLTNSKGHNMLPRSSLAIHICVGELCHTADSRLAPSQWETSLQRNAVSHWLGANLESALWLSFMHRFFYLFGGKTLRKWIIDFCQFDLQENNLVKS